MLGELEWKYVAQQISPVHRTKYFVQLLVTNLFIYLFLIGIHSMQDWRATRRHGVTRKEAQKRLQDKQNLFRKNPQLKDVC